MTKKATERFKDLLLFIRSSYDQDNMNLKHIVSCTNESVNKKTLYLAFLHVKVNHMERKHDSR